VSALQIQAADEKMHFIGSGSQVQGGIFKKSDIGDTPSLMGWRSRFFWASGITRQGNMKRYEK
jgi:hypothetical protein